MPQLHAVGLSPNPVLHGFMDIQNEVLLVWKKTDDTEFAFSIVIEP